MPLQENVVLEHAPCPHGCNEGDEAVLTASDLLHEIPGEFNVVKCRSCGLMRTTPRPTAETISTFYPDNYAPYLHTKVDNSKPTPLIKKLLKPVIKKIFNLNTQRVPPLRPGRMLEVGCAAGAFMHEMASLGWQVEGIEFSGTAAHAASQLGYKVHAGSLETAPPPDEQFDLIVGWMVLEHLHNPVNGLKKLREWTKPGGWLALSIPNAASWEMRYFKNKWYALQVPTHLHHFTPDTIRKTLEAGGWELESIHHQRVLTNLIVSAGYTLNNTAFSKLGQKLIKLPRGNRVLVYALYPLSWLLSKFGQTGRMTVWARIK